MYGGGELNKFEVIAGNVGKFGAQARQGANLWPVWNNFIARNWPERSLRAFDIGVFAVPAFFVILAE
jgi:hypothetical protein